MNDVIELFKSIEEVDSDGKLNYSLDLLNRDELVSTLVEIEKVDTDNFLKIKETLTRIGIANREDKLLYSSCVLLHKKGKFYICHFKELLGMDGKETQIYLNDYARRNKICEMLEKWGLIKVKNSDIMYCISPKNEPINVYVLPYKDKRDWQLISKYKIGTVPTKK